MYRRHGVLALDPFHYPLFASRMTAVLVWTGHAGLVIPLGPAIGIPYMEVLLGKLHALGCISEMQSQLVVTCYLHMALYWRACIADSRVCNAVEFGMGIIAKRAVTYK